MDATKPPFETDARLDALMSVLMTLHELEVIADPAVSSARKENGTAITVEFLLDFDRSAGLGLLEDETGRPNNTTKG